MHATQTASKHSRLAVFWAVLGAFGMLVGFPYLVALNQLSLQPLNLS